jgi:CRISPR-associated exonuclease Cas4
MVAEEDLLPLSGLQHLRFCERQWGLIHIEHQWAENRLTAEGRVLHEKAHQSASESRPGIRITRSLRLQSLRLGLSGVADVVEFHQADQGVVLQGCSGFWRPFPVEYKRGKPKHDSCDEIQLCAQALCMEEMFNCVIERGALFYGQPRRRTAVEFDKDLRQTTEMLTIRMHELYATGRTPPPVASPKCDQCSLVDLCAPRLLESPRAVALYLSSALATSEE